MHLISKLNLLLYSSLALAACGGGGGNSNSGGTTPVVTIDDSKLVPGCFSASGSNPLLTTGSQFSNANWNDPSVIKVGNSYVMYAAADINFSQDIKIYRLTSTDGDNWTLNPTSAVLSKATGPTDWDRKSVETPSVVFFNGQYHMFYTAYPVSLSIVSDYKIGHATSDDGISWTRDTSYLLAPTDPLNVVPDLSFDQYLIAEPGAVVFNGKLYVYFTASGADFDLQTTLETIGVISSSDGINWSSPLQVLKPDQTLYPRVTYRGYSTPSAVVINNRMHLFYDVAEDPFVQTKIHHAVSDDGISNFVQDNQEIFDRNMFSITTSEINGPSPLLDGTQLKLYFAGRVGLDLSIALSNCELASP